MNPINVRLDDKTQAIVNKKAEELKAVYGGEPNVSAAIRNIILEWDWMQSMGQGKPQKQVTK